MRDHVTVYFNYLNFKSIVQAVISVEVVLTPVSFCQNSFLDFFIEFLVPKNMGIESNIMFLDQLEKDFVGG